MFSSLFADPMRALIFAAAHLFGGNLGGGILAVSLAARIAFLPLTLRLARRAEERRRVEERLKPELARLKKRFAGQPERFAGATQALYRREGLEMIDSQAILGGLARWPVVGGIYGALRSARGLGSFAWIRDLAKPNVPLALIVTAGSAAAAYASSHGGNARAAIASIVIGGTLSLVFLWHMSAAVALSWGASVTGDVVQSVILLRERRRAAR